MDEEHGCDGSGDRGFGRCSAKVQAVPQARVEESSPDRRRSKQPADFRRERKPLGNAVARNSLEAGKRTLGDNGAESRLDRERLD
jgi:hypothetical protein